jgi:hypothetical protein
VSNSPECELEKFLAALHPALRKLLEHGAHTLTRDENGEACNALSFGIGVPDFRIEYARLLQPFPSKLREYRKRFELEQAAASRELFPLPPIPEGRPRKDALADEAAQLKESGLSYAKVAIRLNQEHGEGTATMESVRKLIKNRKPKSAHGTASPPDKTQS